jgi:hypothetical protein
LFPLLHHFFSACYRQVHGHHHYQRHQKWHPSEDLHSFK